MNNKIFAKLNSNERTMIFRIISWGIFFAIVISPIIWENINNTSNQHFIYLADAFLNGKTYIDPQFIKEIPLDYTFYNGNYYWPEAPFSAIILLPFVYLFGTTFLQGYLHFIVFLIIFGLLFLLCRNFSFSKENSLFLATGFSFGSIFYGIIMVPWSYFLSQSFSLLFILLAIIFYFKKRNWLLIGLCVALAIFTRYTLIFTPLFFLAMLISEYINISKRELIKKVALFSAPIFLIVISILSYNYVRFDGVLKTGYEGHSVGVFDYYNFSEYALFGVENIPGNLYYYFLKMPDPLIEGNSLHLIYPYIAASPVSMSFLLVSPLFLFAFFKPKKEEKIVVYTLWIVSALQLLFLLSFFSSGTAQINGPRYMLDILPWLFVLVLIRFQNTTITKNIKILIIVSSIINLYFITSILHPGVLGISTERLQDNLYYQLQ